MSTERRTSVRLLVQLDALLDGDDESRMCQTVDLSEIGMLVSTRRPMPVGTRVRVQFLFPGDPTLARYPLPGDYRHVVATAEVVRHADPTVEHEAGIGLRFIDFEGHGRQLVAEFVATHLRETRSADE